MINKNKFILFLLFLLIIAVPVSFAGDNSTCEITGDGETFEHSISEDVNISVSDDNELMGASGDIYFDASASSGGDGSQSRPYNTVTSSYLGTTNYFASGTYTISSTLNPYSYSGMSFIGADRDSTILLYSGSDYFISTSYSITFQNITLKGGSVSTTGGTLTATDTVFDSGVAKQETETDNRQYGNSYGGAIKQGASYGIDWGSLWGGGSGQELIITNCIFRNNYAAYGGAIYSEKAKITITNSRFENNRAENGGGAISASAGATLSVDSCEFINDQSLYDAGGAVYVYNVTSASIKDSQFTNCSAGLGGAVASIDSPTTVATSTFNSNNVTWTGGALFAMFGKLTVTSSNFYDNSAYHGGAIYADNLTNFEVNGGQFSRNNAYGYGGAIFAFTNAADKITNPTYTSNSAANYNDLYQTTGFQLMLGSDDYEMIQYKSDYTGTPPSKYDLRTLNAVTPVKDQGITGNCWAYATIAVLESAIYKATGQQVILSEGNLKNLACIFSDIGWRYDVNEGGMYPFSLGYLTSWAGPVLNSLDPTDDLDIIAPVLNSAYHIQNIMFLQRTSYTDNDAIKKAIMDYGALASEIYWDNSYLNGNNYYCSADTDRNHAICVVGWDDSKSISGAPGPGAWIIKNSYGADRGDGGYYYVSYYDHTLFRLNDESYNSYAIIFNDTVRYNKNYQYDAAMTDYFLTNTFNKVMWYKNTFTSTGNDILTAFSTYFRKVTSWEAQIFVNDELKLTQSGTSNPGYYTIGLDEDIPLKLGDTFTVSLKIQCSSTADIPISESGNPYTMLKEYFKEGVSFFSTDGVTWNDFYRYSATYGSGDAQHIYFNQVACLKAFTREGPREFLNTTMEIIAVNSTGVYLSILDQRGGDVNVGEVEIIIDGKSYTVSVSSSMAAANAYLKAGSHTISAEYIANSYYNTSSLSAAVTLPKEDPIIVISADDIAYGDSLEVKIQITNAVGDIITVPFTAELNSRKYSQSQFTVSGLSPQSYTIKVVTESSDDFNGITAEKTVVVSKASPTLTLEISDVSIGEDITVKVELSNSISGTVNVTVNGVVYQINVNNGEGSRIISNTLNAATYTAQAVFGGNDYYSQAAASKTFTVKKLTPALTVFADDVLEGQSAAVKVYLPSDITSALSLSINSKTYTKNAAGGEATFDISGLALGKYTFTVTFAGDLKYNSASATGTVEVLEKLRNDSMMNVSDSLGDDYVIISVELPEDSQGSVELNFNSLIFTKTPVNGKTSFKISQLESGTYDYTVTFSGDLQYKSSIVKKSVDMVNTKKTTPGISIYADDIYEGETAVITVTLPSDISDYIYLTINSIVSSANALNGQATFNINGLSADTYSFTVNFPGNSRYNPVTLTDSIKVMKKSEQTPVETSSIKAYDMKRAYLSDYDFEATFYDGRGNLLTNKMVIFEVNGNEYEVQTNKYGAAQLKTQLSAGVYNVTVTNPLTGEKVTRQMTIVARIAENTDIQMDYSFKSTFKVRVYGDNGAVVGAGEKVTFTLNGAAKIVQTDKNGYASFVIDIKPGKYSLTTEYRGVKAVNNVVVKQVLTAKNMKFKKSKKVKKFKATLKTSSGKAIVGKKLTVKVNGKTYTAKTNKKGVAVFKIKNLKKKGKYRAAVTYLKTSVTKTITVRR